MRSSEYCATGVSFPAWSISITCQLYPRNPACIAVVAHTDAATETSTATAMDNGTNLVIVRTYSPPFWSQTVIPALLDAEDFRTVPGSEAELCGRYPRPTRRR